MKKILLFLLVLVATFVLASCGQDEKTPEETGNENQQTENLETTVESAIQKILDEAASLEDKETLEGERTVVGTVKEITEAYSSQYKNITFVLTDGTADILVFRAKGDCASTLKVGDAVTVTGEVINYAGTIEFQYAALTTENGGETLEGFVTIQSILDEAATLEDGSTLSGNRKTVGTVKEITEAYSSQYKNITFILTDGTADILVFRGKGNCASTLAVGDKVYVDGEVINYGGTIEFQYAALTTDNDNNNQPSLSVELMSVAEVLEAASGLADGAQLSNELKASGVVTNFEKKFSYSGGDYYQFYLVDGDSKVLVYKPQGAIVESLQNGETVYVKGIVKNYKGTIEFDSAVVSYADDFDKTYVEKLTAEEKTPVIPQEVTGNYEFISLPMAIAIAMDGGEDFQSSEKYYITGWVSSVSNYSYGSITITDGNVSIFAYGISGYSKDGSYPIEGDVVVLEAVIGTNGSDVELKNATKLVEWHDVAVDTNEYTNTTIEQARNAEAGEKLVVEGVVVGFTYKNAKTSSGEYVRDALYLVSGNSSILVYAPGVASVVEVGNTITVAGVKEYFVQESEVELAIKYGFTGACQLSNAYLVSNKGGNTAIDSTVFETVTVKELMENEYDENITNQIYKVRALITKADSGSYVNYYINDLDEKTGTYTYTKCNGNDFAWLDKYLSNNQYFCELLVTVCNAKATANGCNWRMIPLTILGDASYDVNNETKDFVFDYFIEPQFENEYYANPALELITTHSSALLGFENVTISYVSSNEEVVKVEVVDGTTILNVNSIGTATLTVTIEHNGTQLVKEITITRAGEPTFDALTVKEAIETPQDKEVIVMGIVAGGVANQKTGFYLIDETGVIAVKMLTTDDLAKIGQGNKVVIKGVREQYKETETLPGQTCIVDAELVHNYYGEHDYSTVTFKDSSLLAISQYPATTDYTTQVYVLEASYYVSGYTVLLQNGQDSIALYCSGSGQYTWLSEYALGTVVKMEVLLCNWNNKTEYKAYVLAVYLEDGTKVVNPTNFVS